MNFSQKSGLFILILISVVYVYAAFFGKDFKLPELKSPKTNEQPQYNPLDNRSDEPKTEKREDGMKTVRIYLLDKSGNLRSVTRDCDTAKETSCFEFAVAELISAPSKFEKSNGFTSEIPSNTRVLSVRESSGTAMIDLSSEFESGGGAESTYMRIKQIIKTANANTTSPVYLYINGKQANVIGGEGVMLKQPLNERSLDE